MFYFAIIQQTKVLWGMSKMHILSSNTLHIIKKSIQGRKHGERDRNGVMREK